MLAFGLILRSPAPAVALSPDVRFHQFEHSVWTLQDGLPQVTVQAVAQGPEGYIWTGTQAGLSRFDGTRFDVFEPADHPVIPTLNTQALFLDSGDRLWIGTTRGPIFRTGKAFHAVAHERASSLDVHGFAETGRGWVLMATDSGLWRTRGPVFEAVELGGPVSLRAVFHHAGESLVGGRGAIFENTGDGWRRAALSASLRQLTVTAFAAHDGRLWAGTTRGLLVREDGIWQRVTSHPELGRRLVEVVYTDRDGSLWVGTNGVLFRLSGGEVIDRWGSDGLFQDGNVLSITEDHEGSLWLGSRSYGVARLWDGYVLRYSAREGLHEGLTWTLARDAAGTLWVGTANGLTRFREGRFHLQVDGSSQPHPHAYSLFPEPGRVWVGTRAGLYWWLPEEDRIVTPEAFAALSGSEVRAVLPFAGDYWIGASSGIWRWDGSQLDAVLPASTDSAHQTRVLLETRDGRLLAGTQGGILEYRVGEGFVDLPGLPGRPDILSLIELEDGQLLAGNRNEQLLVQHDGKWQVIGEAQGAPSNAIYAMAAYGGRLWVGGNRGLYRFSLDDLQRFLDGDIPAVDSEVILSERGDVPGAQNTPCCNGAGNARVAVSGGALWFASRDGIVAVEPDRIRRNPVPPALRINRLRTGDHWQLLDGQGPVVLSPERRDVDIGFAALSFQDPRSARFTYRMLGFQDDWQQLDPGSARVAYYTNLPPGDLRFQVRGSNNAGVWADMPAELTVRVQPRWYETHAVRGLAFAVALLLLLLGFHLNSRRMKRRELALSRLIEARTDELRIANNHLREYSHKLEAASMTDPLTGLWNRRYFTEEVRSQLRDFSRDHAVGLYRDRCMLVALLDLDLFKRINDCYGHDAGDRVLRQFADFLRSLVHPRDHVLRWGGEEFLLVFQPLPESEVTALASRIHQALRRHRFTLENGEPITLTCSMGLAIYPPCDGDDADTHWEVALGLADKGLYGCKQKGRDSWLLVTANASAAVLSGALASGIDGLVAAGHVTVTSASED